MITAHHIPIMITREKNWMNGAHTDPIQQRNEIENNNLCVTFTIIHNNNICTVHTPHIFYTSQPPVCLHTDVELAEVRLHE